MTENLLVAVSAYAGDADQVNTNLPLYEHHGARVLILSPADAPINSVPTLGRVECMQAGARGWAGPHTLVRQRLFLELLSRQSAEFFLLNDSDSFCLSPALPECLFAEPGVFWSNEVTDTNPSPSLLPKIAVQPPYFFSRAVLEKFLQFADKPATSFTAPSPEGWPLPIPTDCIDHWMLQVVCAAGIPHRSFQDGASFETKSEHGLATMVEHVELHGRIFLHSVKEKAAVLRLLAARRNYVRNNLRARR